MAGLQRSVYMDCPSAIAVVNANIHSHCKFSFFCARIALLLRALLTQPSALGGREGDAQGAVQNG